MTATPPPPVSLPCRRDPERWFDPRHRRDALSECLACPARVWCAREALSSNASWGMWAGVWIDDDHRDAATHLQVIAADRASSADVAAPRDLRPDRADSPAAPAPLPSLLTAGPPGSARAAVLARSCGHCEVFAEGCRYSFDHIVRRCPTDTRDETCSAASLFAACNSCSDIIAELDRRLAARSGYRVPAGRDPAAVPFHWRASRWVLLGRNGWLTEIRDDAQTA